MANERRVLALALAAGFAARLWFVATTYGTNDAAFMTLWADLAERFGVAGAYAHNRLLNHPPLSLWIIRELARLGNVADLLRLVQIAADGASFAILLRLGRTTAPALLYFLSPVAILISGFHCNTDPTMICLILGAVVLLDRYPAASGGLLALASGIKILPLLIVPLFWVAAGKRRWRWAGAFAFVFAAVYVPAVIAGGAPVLRNVFGYAGEILWWGFPALAARLDLPAAFVIGHARALRFLVVALCVAVCALYARRGGSLPAAIAVTYAGVLFIATGIGVQYLLWPLPFLPFVCRRAESLVLHAASTVLIASMYTSWSRGWPWTYADSFRTPWPMMDWLLATALVVWALFGALFAAGVYRLAADGQPVSPAR